MPLTSSSAPGPSRSTLRSIVKSISPAVSAAAERVVAVPRHLDELAADRLEHLARRVIHAVVPAERARVVVGDAVAELLLRCNTAALQQLEQELRVVQHRPLAAVLRV